MSRTAPQIGCSPEVRQTLQRFAASRTESKQTVERARIILGCLDGKRVQLIARECHTRSNTVIKWWQRFVQSGLVGLNDAMRPGARLVYGADFCNRVLAILEQPPSAGQACWDGPAVATQLNGSVHAVWRVLRKEGILAAFLVRQHRQGVCGQSRRHCRIVSQPTGECLGHQRG